MTLDTRPSVSRRSRTPAADPRSRIATRTALGLAKALAELRFDGLQRTGATRLVTRAVVAWAEAQGWLPVTEMPLAFLEDTPDYPGRQGIVDLFIARKGYRRDLVIEIDRGNKTWSARKLGYAVENGNNAIWIRWSGPGPMADIVPAGVEVIYLETRHRPRVAAAEIPLEPVPAPLHGGLSGASRALLSALYPAGAPADDPGWQDEAEVWRRVSELLPRLELILRCRFGRYGPRPLTLERTSDVVADELGMDVVSRERVRQLQKQALRRLRARAGIRLRRARRQAGPVPEPHAMATKPRRKAGMTSPLPDTAALCGLVLEILAAAGPSGLRRSMVCHVLRGSQGPATRERVARWSLPNHGTLAGTDYGELYEAVSLLCEYTPTIRLVDGSLRINKRPVTVGTVSG